MSCPATVAASIPVQNQEAAQKLLQKINQPNYNNRNSRNHRPRGRFREEEESNFLTLDEWERRKHGVELPPTHFNPGTSQDEDLARQLQEQFDLEDVHVIICYPKKFHTEYSVIVNLSRVMIHAGNSYLRPHDKSSPTFDKRNVDAFIAIPICHLLDPKHKVDLRNFHRFHRITRDSFLCFWSWKIFY